MILTPKNTITYTMDCLIELDPNETFKKYLEKNISLPLIYIVVSIAHFYINRMLTTWRSKAECENASLHTMAWRIFSVVNEIKLANKNHSC